MASQITNLTNFADQVIGLQLPDGSSFTLELIFNGATERWTANIVYNARIINGINVCCYPNVLQEWENVIPFGIACTTVDQTDPFDVNDFSTGRASLFLLTKEDIAIINAVTFGKPTL